MQLNFDNRFVRELPGDDGGGLSRQTPGVCWARAKPEPVGQPRLLAYASEVSTLLNLTDADVHREDFLAAFSGNALLPGMVHYATRYGGHQFGQWAGQLGDGRAIGLGEVVNRAGERWELQLKGAGPTSYSRRADGRAVLRSSLREFLCSEAMHHLGVPSTRALCLIGTGEQVMRDMLYSGDVRPEQGAIVCRVAPSFIRFGNFEMLASRNELELLRRLVDFTIDRDFPMLEGAAPERFAGWFRLVCARTASLMVEWLRVGFVHGVMNTDNMSILGLTLDYGPYGWIDNWDPGWTPNTTDAAGRRYCFAQQPAMARWNLERLADALMAVAPSCAVLEEGLAHFDATFQSGLSAMLAAKFGLLAWQDEDGELVETLFELMQRAEIDMTEFFRALAEIDLDDPRLETLHAAFYRQALYLEHGPAIRQWLQRYAARLSTQADSREQRRARMNRVNP
ncbi:MAG TPA: YdiU family protein, partial [Gallionella sp.]|nr:YdiU family protein [Gallionella sp.]